MLTSTDYFCVERIVRQLQTIQEARTIWHAWDVDLLSADDEHNYILRLHIGRSSMASGPAGYKIDDIYHMIYYWYWLILIYIYWHCRHIQAQIHIIDDWYLFSIQFQHQLNFYYVWTVQQWNFYKFIVNADCTEWALHCLALPDYPRYGQATPD